MKKMFYKSLPVNPYHFLKKHHNRCTYSSPVDTIYYMGSHIHGRKTLKTHNPKCRLHWCIIEFIDWRYSQLCWYFRLLLWALAHLPSLWPPPPHPPPPHSQSKRTVNKAWLGRGGGCWVVLKTIFCRSSTLFLTGFGNPQNCYTTPNENDQ